MWKRGLILRVLVVTVLSTLSWNLYSSRDPQFGEAPRRLGCFIKVIPTALPIDRLKHERLNGRVMKADTYGHNHDTDVGSKNLGPKSTGTELSLLIRDRHPPISELDLRRVPFVRSTIRHPSRDGVSNGAATGC